MTPSGGSTPYEEKWKEACTNRKKERTHVLDNSLETAALQAIIDFLKYFTDTFKRIGNLPDPNTEAEEDLIKEAYQELDAFWKHLATNILPAIKEWDKNRWDSIWQSLNNIKGSPDFAGAWAKARTLMGVLKGGSASSSHNTELFFMRNELMDFATYELDALIQRFNDITGDWASQ